MTRQRYRAAKSNNEVLCQAADERELMGLTDQTLREEFDRINSGYKGNNTIFLAFAHKSTLKDR